MTPFELLDCDGTINVKRTGYGAQVATESDASLGSAANAHSEAVRFIKHLLAGGKKGDV
jgi:hypothetical protein